MTRHQLTPFAPGQAFAPLQRLGEGDGILLLTQDVLDRVVKPPAGIVVVGAAPCSHAMIRLLDLGVPVLTADRMTADALPLGQPVWMDGERGLLIGPGDTQPVAPMPEPPRGPVMTADGERVLLHCTVASAAGAALARARGAEAIGLVRTEYLLPEADVPPQRRDYEVAFAALLDAAHPLPVTLRFLDVAVDKRPGWLGARPAQGGPLGMQGARLFGHGPAADVFHAQLGALAHLADRHAPGLLLPYLTSPEEFVHWRDEVRHALPRPLSVGAMVETPALAMMTDTLTGLADSVSLGLNDLMQCLFAADRDQPELAGYLDPHAPGLYRFLSRVAELAEGQVGRVQLCGLLPQLPGTLPALLGLGFRVFSVNPYLVPFMARRVSRIRFAQARDVARQVCAAPDAATVRALLADAAPSEPLPA
ncbi:phosphoenolpyruvate-protein phosphotransferase [Thioalkalivibrio denitrificans]|uniref:Phosphoenolpyruvate-protein phosphotransferase n=1 Tax=Thioalkalivibrio denitrificans TaxID=108003 RepID=A0A1V3NI05_9GAMM|nr:putative PEP-binding protein [Thioalkalivibrio denitrificans]OOG24739.1 phosphoenolpyruvate-protein phosphotransferase [Thioalkalivibrio denitrificans]